MSSLPSTRFSTLWSGVRGEMRRELQSGGFTGAVACALSGVARRIILLALGPVGEFVVPFSDFFIRSGVIALQRSWNRAIYNVRTTRSGLTVLERPRISTPQSTLLTVPQRLELPTETLIDPPAGLLLASSHRRVRAEVPSPVAKTWRSFATGGLNPSQRMWLSAQTRSSLRTAALPPRLTALDALLSQGLGGTPMRYSIRRDSSPVLTATARAFGRSSDLSSLTDVEYPAWVFENQVYRHPFGRTTASESNEFFKWYMGDRARAGRMRDTACLLSKELPSKPAPRAHSGSGRKASVPEIDDRGFWERVVDKIDEWLG